MWRDGGRECVCDVVFPLSHILTLYVRCTSNTLPSIFASIIQISAVGTTRNLNTECFKMATVLLLRKSRTTIRE